MTSMFKPKMPAVPEPVKPPTTDDARQAEEEMLRLRRRRGRASTFLAGARGRPSAAAMLGSGVTASFDGYSGGSGASTGSNSNDGGGRARDRIQ